MEPDTQTAHPALKDALPDLVASAPLSSTLAIGGKTLTTETRRALKAQLEAGDLDEIVFDAVVWRDGPNANCYRFRDKDLSAFAASFSGQPFLRNHDTRDIGSRDGTIAASRLDSKAFTQTIRLTTERGMRSFLEEQIDRFSIGWYFDSITCSVCNADWLSRTCFHWPGRRYEVKDDNGDEKEVLCELIFENPRGKETSAVNAPAVDGTKVLAELCEYKLSRFPPTPQSEGVGTIMEEKDTPTVTVERDETPTTEERAALATPSLHSGQAVPQAPPPAPDPAPWLNALREQVIESALRNSRLPAASQQQIRLQLADAQEVTPDRLDALIEQQRTLVAQLQEDRVISGVGTPIDSARVSGMLSSVDKVEAALTALIEGRRPASGIRPLTGIREAYILLSGDYDMHGMFHPENVGLAAVNSTTMAGIVANAMNKVVVNQFQRYPRPWEPVVTRRDFTNLQTVRWITLGGVGELPTVGEGAAYTELDWDDQTETSAWTKKGGYLAITLETIDKDDTDRVQQVPLALAQAAWLTLYKAFANIFSQSSGVGPTMSDSKALFHNDHNNLGSTALSYTAWDATRTAMRKQTELNSGERLGGIVVPRYLLVPPDLEGTALTVLLSEGQPGTANNDENPWAEGNDHEARRAAARRRVIVVDLWTDTDNWAAIADPMLYPSIGLGYRFGETPEIFSVASDTNGLMFTNDAMPVKVRYFYAIGPTDWRGLYKHNV